MPIPPPDVLSLGFDIGSIACKCILTDSRGGILDQSYDRTQGRPLETAISALTTLLARHPGARLDLVAGTGSAARIVCDVLRVPFVNEVICQAMAIRRLHPDVRTLIEMGGQDSKLIFLPTDPADPRPMIDFAMNTNCAAGTGSFLDQQASRLGVRIEDEFGALALQSQSPPRVAGRCSVFAKSDMIHLQQQAAPVHDIVAGLCLGLARNLKSNLAGGRALPAPIAFTGGVAANRGVVAALEQVLELPRGGLIVPHAHACTGASARSSPRCANACARRHLRPPRRRHASSRLAPRIPRQTARHRRSPRPAPPPRAVPQRAPTARPTSHRRPTPTAPAILL